MKTRHDAPRDGCKAAAVASAVDLVDKTVTDLAQGHQVCIGFTVDVGIAQMVQLHGVTRATTSAATCVTSVVAISAC